MSRDDRRRHSPRIEPLEARQLMAQTPVTLLPLGAPNSSPLSTVTLSSASVTAKNHMLLIKVPSGGAAAAELAEIPDGASYGLIMVGTPRKGVFKDYYFASLASIGLEGGG